MIPLAFNIHIAANTCADMRKFQIFPQTRFYGFGMSTLLAEYNREFTRKWVTTKKEKIVQDYVIFFIFQSVLTVLFSSDR